MTGLPKVNKGQCKLEKAKSDNWRSGRACVKQLNVIHGIHTQALTTGFHKETKQTQLLRIVIVSQ